jgi:hypothetical protein
LALFAKHAELITPEKIVPIEGPPGHCFETALTYAVAHPTSRPYLGFGFFTEVDGTKTVWLHNINVESDGSFIDSARPLTELFLGVRWGLELWRAVPKKQPAANREQRRRRERSLPDVFRRPAYVTT